jgi:hypothetical protein
MFDDIINDELEKLKEMIENNKLSNDKLNNFISDYDWEDEFSHNDIGDMQEEFIKQAKNYLIENCIESYIIFCDWSVHICTVDFFNKYLPNFHGRYEVC